jgi:hypothetical protein
MAVEYYNNILSVETNWLIKEGIISETYLKKLIYTEKSVKQMRRACKNTPALVDYHTMPNRFREEIEKKLGGNPLELINKEPMRTIETDYNAFDFYSNFRYPDGSLIPTNKQDNIVLYSNGACILNALRIELESHTRSRAAHGRKPMYNKFYGDAVKMIKRLNANDQWPNLLPTNPRTLREKLEDYIKNGYKALIKHYKGNNNARKISAKLEKLICYIATMPTRPYNTKIVEIYNQFMGEEFDLVDENRVDKKTGEVLNGYEFNREDFLDNEGKPVKFSESRAWQIVNDNRNQIQINKKRMGYKDFDERHRPHRHRHAPQFSFSKISLDDRDLIWKDTTTKQRVKAYYAYDVTSGCRIGSAYSQSKDEALFLDCLRDMFVFIDRHGFGIPLEVEVENHLVRKYELELSIMFPRVTFCAPANSKEKRAEHFNRAVKYQVEKNNHPGVGRWWLKSVYNRIPVDKVDDQFRQTMKAADRMIVDDIKDTIEYNNAPHPNQKRYPGKTRIQVLTENINPELPQLNKALVYKHIGFEVKSINIYNTQYVKVQYAKYQLPHPSVVEQLAPNNLKVDAYYMPDNDGNIPEVYLYQNGEFICIATKLETYNESKAERTAEDDAAKLKQDKYVAMFDKYAKKEDWAKLGIVPRTNGKEHDDVEVFTPKKSGISNIDDLDFDDYGDNAVSEF